RGAALEQATGTGEEADAVDDGRDLFRVGDGGRLANVFRLGLRELVAVGLDRLRELQHSVAALAGRAVRPAAIERLAGRCDRTVDVLVGPFRDVGDDLAGRGIDDLLHLAARAGCPLAADEHVVTSKRRAHDPSFAVIGR